MVTTLRLAVGQAKIVTDAGGSLIDLPALLCEGDKCPITFANRIVYRDVWPLTVGVTRLAMPYFAWVVDEAPAGRSRVWPGP